MTATMPRNPWLLRAASLALLGALCLAGMATSAAGAGSPPASAVSGKEGGGLIVRARPGREAQAEVLVKKLGGTVRRRLRIVNGFSATLPAGALATLRAGSAILSVTPDRTLEPQSSSYSAAYDPGSDGYSMSSITTLAGARDWWNAGYTGRGVDVALIDSGVSPVQGLNGVSKIVNGPDLSLESQAPNLRYLDTYGHGTFMAGLIGGRDAAPNSQAPASTYLGMAPDARIVSLKVATADGGTDVSQVIAAVDWVVQHRADYGLNIRVLNLSYGTNSLQDYQTDPLAFAVEQAWKKGIVVVAAAGNTGFQRGKGAPGLADPAFDPYVIGVAASDTMGTKTSEDDVVASFSASSCGKGCKKPDFTAPGSHVQGLRVPNGWVDTNHPEGFLDTRYFRGSGTSQAAAIVSGAVALVLQKYPDLVPDQVKKFFRGDAVKLNDMPPAAQGAGEIQMTGMLEKAPRRATQTFNDSTGTGSIESSRGQDHISRDGVALEGEQDIFGSPISTVELASSEAAGSSWSEGAWNGSSWSGSSWSGSSWSTIMWSGSSWSGSSWSGSTWSTSSWSGSSWSTNAWTGSSWSGDSWTGNNWAVASWG